MTTLIANEIRKLHAICGQWLLLAPDRCWSSSASPVKSRAGRT
jgi:hypothetical protein